MDAICSVCGKRATRHYVLTRVDTGEQLKGYLCRECALDPIGHKWDNPQPKLSAIKIDIYQNSAPQGSDGQYLTVPEGVGA